MVHQSGHALDDNSAHLEGASVSYKLLYLTLRLSDAGFFVAGYAPANVRPQISKEPGFKIILRQTRRNGAQYTVRSRPGGRRYSSPGATMYGTKLARN